jgi:hypothetical protein
MDSETRFLLDKFKQDMESVRSLARFDRIVVDTLHSQLSSLKALVDKHQPELKGIQRRLEPTCKLLSTVRDHSSTILSYRTIYNQCIVLQVSYFAAALEDVFVHFVGKCLRDGNADRIWHQDIKAKVKDVWDGREQIEACLAEQIISSSGISFQDMKSIRRAFRDFLGADDREKDECVNDIIIAQAARHAIVHSAAKVDRHLLNQVRNAIPRTLFPDIGKQNELAFSIPDIELVGNRMIQFLERVLASAVASHPNKALPKDKNGSPR